MAKTKQKSSSAARRREQARQQGSSTIQATPSAVPHKDTANQHSDAPEAPQASTQPREHVRQQTVSSVQTTSSAAQRREQMRQQRPSGSTTAPTRAKSKSTRKQVKKGGVSPWIWVGGVLAGLALIVGVFFYLSNQQSNTGTAQGGQTDPTVLKAVTSVSPSVISQVGPGPESLQKSVPQMFQGTPSNTPLLTGPQGKPQIFYYGAEFCPYCAAQRWAMVVALSRFGTFTKLPETTSSSTDVYPNTATFTFRGSEYSSHYVDFVPLENEDRDQNVIQTPTAQQQQLLSKYNVTGYPFIDIAERYTIASPLYSTAVLTGLSQKDIAGQLSNPDSTVAQNIVGSANYLTAAICSATQNQPGSVCNAAPIPSIQKILPKTAISPGNGPLAIAAAGQLEMVTRRQEGLI